MSFWNNEEVIKLFNFVETEKNNTTKMSEIFKKYAKISNRKPNSVRNYYYMEIAFDKKENRLEKLGIKRENHIVKKNEKFSDKETKELFDKIENLKHNGESVRSACLKLANGNLEEMVRLQNKYRVESKKRKEKQIQNSFEQQSVLVNKNNIITLPKKNKTLSDSDINSLFLGLVKLVKKNAIEEANQNLIKDATFANEALRKTLMNLSKRENEINSIRREFKLLKKENENLKTKLNDYKNQSQNNKLKEFVSTLPTNSKIAKS